MSGSPSKGLSPRRKREREIEEREREREREIERKRKINRLYLPLKAGHAAPLEDDDLAIGPGNRYVRRVSVLLGFQKGGVGGGGGWWRGG